MSRRDVLSRFGLLAAALLPPALAGCTSPATPGKGGSSPAAAEKEKEEKGGTDSDKAKPPPPDPRDW
jgi:hypothetical protein